MANSKYEYVRSFEAPTDTPLLPDCFIVVRVDGIKFHAFSREHNFRKPNDKRCLDLMIQSAKCVMKKFSPDIVLSYGQSDEFSFMFRRSCTRFNRRMNKLTSVVPSLFAAAFVRNWSNFFPDTLLRDDPAFDARCVLYPNIDVLLDYLRWRQVDCHINNLYNTTFHALTGDYIRYQMMDGEFEITPLEVYSSGGSKTRLSPQEATARLSGTVSGDKNEILFSEFSVNYNNELEQFKKGSIIVLTEEQVNKFKKEAKIKPPAKVKNESASRPGAKSESAGAAVVNDSTSQSLNTKVEVGMNVLHTDIINEAFWSTNRYLFDFLQR